LSGPSKNFCFFFKQKKRKKLGRKKEKFHFSFFFLFPKRQELVRQELGGHGDGGQRVAADTSSSRMGDDDTAKEEHGQ
jgi:hypothetical protein